MNSDVVAETFYKYLRAVYKLYHVCKGGGGEANILSSNKQSKFVRPIQMHFLILQYILHVPIPIKALSHI